MQAANVRKPLQLLYKSLNRRIEVKLKSNTVYRGRLLKVDDYMNLYLVEAEEEGTKGPLANLGHVVIRGNNILYVRIEEAI